MIVYENVPSKLRFLAQLWKILERRFFLSGVDVANIVKYFQNLKHLGSPFFLNSHSSFSSELNISIHVPVAKRKGRLGHLRAVRFQPHRSCCSTGPAATLSWRLSWPRPRRPSAGGALGASSPRAAAVRSSRHSHLFSFSQTAITLRIRKSPQRHTAYFV